MLKRLKPKLLKLILLLGILLPLAQSQIAYAAPTVPTLSGTAHNQRNVLSWTAATGGVGTITYNLKRGATVVFTGTALTYTDVISAVNVTSSYTVTATDTLGTSAPSNTVTLKTGEPLAISGVAGNGQITLNWTGTSYSLQNYKLYRQQVIGTQGGTGNPIYTGLNLTFTDTGLTNGTTYDYWVYSYQTSTQEQSSLSTVPASQPNDCATYPACPLHQTPQQTTAPVLSGQAGNAQNTLNWTAIAGATAYELKQGSTVIYTGTALTFVKTGLTNGTQYSYTVKADVSGNVSPPSNTVLLTPANPAEAQNITPRDIKLIGLGFATLIGWLTIKQFRFRND